MFTNITELKRQLNIEPEYTSNDAYLQLLCDVAESAVISYCDAIVSGTTGTTLNLSGTTHNITMTGYQGNHTDVSIAVVQATYLIAANLFVNRQPVSFGQPYEIPYTFRFLLDPYKNFVVV
jgi:hypothetical protein